MDKKQFGLLLALVCALLGYFSCGLALQGGVAVPAVLYWFFFLAIPSLSLFLMSDNDICNVLILLLNSFAVYSLYFLQNTTWYPSMRDTQYEMQVVYYIYNHGAWIPGIGTGFAESMNLNPAMHIFLTSVSLIAGFQPYQAMFLVPWLKGVGIMMFFYLIARDFLSKPKIVFFASMVFLSTVWYFGFPHRELFAEILFMCALWIYLRKNVSTQMKAVFILLVFALTMSHHFTAYVFLAVVVAIYLFESKRRNEMIHPLIPAVFVVSWMVFLSLTVFSEYAVFFIKAVETVFLARVPVGPRFAAMSYYYTPFENIMIFLNPLLVGALALPPFLKEMRAKNERSLLAITLVFGTLLVIAILFFAFKVVMGAAFQRIWGFAYVALAIWAGLFFWKKVGNARLRIVVSLAVIVVLFASMNVSSMETGIKKWYVPREYMEAYMYSDSMVNTAQWCGNYLNGSILGDHFAYDMIGSWAYKEVDVWAFEDWYRTNDSKIPIMFDYIILSPLDMVTYLDTFREPIDPFAMLPINTDVIYDGGDFVVYQNSRR